MFEENSFFCQYNEFLSVQLFNSEEKRKILLIHSKSVVKSYVLSLVTFITNYKLRIYNIFFFNEYIRNVHFFFFP